MLLLGKMLILQQLTHHHHRGQRCFQLVGNIRKGISKKQLILLQTLLLQLQRARDFVEITMQYAKLPFLVLRDIKSAVPLINLLQIHRQRFQLCIPVLAE